MCVQNSLKFTEFVHDQANKTVINIDSRSNSYHFGNVLIVHVEISSRHTSFTVVIDSDTNAVPLFQFDFWFCLKIESVTEFLCSNWSSDVKSTILPARVRFWFQDPWCPKQYRLFWVRWKAPLHGEHSLWFPHDTKSENNSVKWSQIRSTSHDYHFVISVWEI